MDFGNEFDQENDLTINILPMIDVLFAILLFFVLSSLILSSNRVVEINRPKATTTTTIGSDDVIVSIKKNGELFINSEPSNQTTLLNDLSIITQQNASKKLLIDAEQTTPRRDLVPRALAVRRGGVTSKNDHLVSVPNVE